MRRAPRPCSSYWRNGLVYSRSPSARSEDVGDDECRALCEALELNTASQLQVLDLADNLIGQKEEVNEFNPEFQAGGEALGCHALGYLLR